MGSFAYLCGSKAAYDSKKAARDAVKRVQSRGGRGVSLYRCPWGDHWHIGRQAAHER